MTAAAGTPGVDRPVHPDDLLGTFAVVCRGPGQVEVIAAPTGTTRRPAAGVPPPRPDVPRHRAWPGRPVRRLP